VISQSFTDFEYIIIDGASTDGSVDIIKKYADKINYWISEPDKGIYNAMNKGIPRAAGQYLLFLNSGDTLYDPAILRYCSEANASEDIIYGDIIYEGNKFPLVMPDEITLGTFLGQSIGHGASFIKATLFEKFGLYNEENRIVSDWEFFLDVFVKSGCSYRHVNRVFTIYQKEGISNNPIYNIIQAQERNAVLRRKFPEFYDIIRENFSLKDELAFYEHSRIIQLFKRLQHSRLNQLRNKYFRFTRE
jgi:glycosyltransferase involved in cell wall biosynthesis